MSVGARTDEAAKPMAVTEDAAIELAAALLQTAGASRENAATVAAHLVESDVCGVASHGLLRVPQYVAELEAGEIDGSARPTVERDRAIVLVDGHKGFGHVAAATAVDEAQQAAASHGVGLATVVRAGHAGRIGAYVEAAAASGDIALAFCSGPKSGHRVAPFGGIDGRLATNPIAYAFPTDTHPIVADFSTSSVPEGVVRRLRELGRQAPEQSLQDAAGNPATDPNVLYADPPGTILPLGGPTFGHKGYALGLLVEAMTTVLCGEDSADETRLGNNLTVLVIDAGQQAAASGGALARYVRGARPAAPDRPVLLPGDPEQRRRAASSAHIQIDAPVWQALVRLADRFGIEAPRP